jgi:hypothetical protein
MMDTKIPEPVDTPEAASQEEAPRKLPRWAIWVAVLAFLIFNSFFMLFVIQMSNSNAN